MTFVLQMKDAKFILEKLDEDSLVIIDELGRGTSIEEGLAICLAVCEALAQKEAFVLLATHFSQVTKLAAIYPNIMK